MKRQEILLGILLQILILNVYVQATSPPGPTSIGAGAPSDDPSRVIFSAVRVKDPPAINNDTTVLFDQVTLNIGNGYDPKTGIFTAPKDGTFSFSFGIRTYTENGIFAHLRVNDNPEIELYTGSGGTGFASASRILGLKSGDKVNIVLYYSKTTGDTISCNNWMACVFSGQMI